MEDTEGAIKIFMNPIFNKNNNLNGIFGENTIERLLLFVFLL